MAEVLIIGAGPAGLAAARAARARGAAVVLLDSSDELGGQYWRHLPAARPSKNEAMLHHGWAKFQRMRDELSADSRCRILTQAQVWAITAPRDGDRPEAGGGLQNTGTAEGTGIGTGTDTAEGTRAVQRVRAAQETGATQDAHTADGGHARRAVHVLIGEPDGADRQKTTFTPDAIVLATGAHDRTLPFPGWDLPGVFTAGAAQALAKGERIAVGQRVLVAGAGPFLLPVAASLVATGSRVLGVLEANRMPRLAAGWGYKPWQLVGASAKGAELAGYVGNHLKHRIPYRTGRGVIAAHGTDRVTSVTTARLDYSWAPIAGTEERIEVDAVCVGHGFTPRLELAVAAGCTLDSDRFVEVDDNQLTSVAGVYAAGEVTGIGGVDCALAEGSIAGHAAAGGSANDPKVRVQTNRRRVFRGFAARIEAAHGIRNDWPGWLTPETVICRCEEVSFGRLCNTATNTASSGLRSLKLSTRAGLGICQGRVCGRTVEELLGRQTGGGALTDGVVMDRRPIAAPIRIAELAASASDWTAEGDATERQATSTPNSSNNTVTTTEP